MSNFTVFLQGLLNFGQALISFVSNLIQGASQMTIMIPSAINMLVQTIGYMPGLLIAFGTAFVTISVTYLIIGR